MLAVDYRLTSSQNKVLTYDFLYNMLIQNVKTNYWCLIPNAIVLFQKISILPPERVFLV